MAVADERLDHADPVGGHGPAKAQIGHHRDHHRVAGQPPAPGPIDGAHRQDLVAVDERSRVVHGQHPVGVAVEGETGIGAGRHHRGLEALGVKRSTAIVDVVAVGLGVDRLDGRSQCAQTLGAGLKGSAVGWIDHDAQPVQVAALDARRDRSDVAAAGLLPHGRAPHGGRALRRSVPARSRAAGRRRDIRLRRGDRTGVVEHGTQAPFDLMLSLIAQLATSGREQLHAVVVPWVVRRRDHRSCDSLIVAPAGHRRSRNHTQVDG